MWLDVGTGKTFCQTAISLYQKIVWNHQTVIIMPPTLLRQWARWLAEITPAVSLTTYTGTPAQRAKLELGSDFVLVGIHIFKRDYDRFRAYFINRPFSVAIDEATIVGNIYSDNHRKVYDFAVLHPQSVLSGTPMNKPIDAYGLMNFSAPLVYENIRAFYDLHVVAWDMYRSKIVEYENLDVLAKNLLINSKRVLFEDMYPDTEEPLIVPFYYDLDPTHYKLYVKLAEEQLLALPDGSNIDGTTANTLTHALGQIVCNWDHFSGEQARVAQVVENIEQHLSELSDGKLAIFAHYKMTVGKLAEKLAKYGAVAYNSTVSEMQKDMNLKKFCHDPKCRVIVIQFISGGKGLDGMQHVCRDIFFAEPCQQPRDFWQCIGRLKRTGQKFKVRVKLGIAQGTTQIRGFKNLLRNDTLLNQVIRNAAELRDVIYGRS